MPRIGLRPCYARDGIEVYHADCRDILPKLAARSVDFIFTDPPYGHNNNNGDLIHRSNGGLGQRTDGHGLALSA